MINIGLRTVDPPVLSLQYIYNESSANEPILLITTSGMDPSTEIADLAKHLNHTYEEVNRYFKWSLIGYYY